MTQQDFQTMRRAMVESQLRTNGVNDPRLTAAMAVLPREWFVPRERATLAYVDRPVPLGNGRFLNTPMATARLVTEAHVREGERALVVGAASGYAAALLSELGAVVTAVECDEKLAEVARAALAGTGVEVVHGPLAKGHEAGAPYQLILVDGAIEHVPDALVEQLADDGRLACATLDRGVSRLAIGRKVAGGGFGLKSFLDAEAVPLPGFAAPRGFAF